MAAPRVDACDFAVATGKTAYDCAICNAFVMGPDHGENRIEITREEDRREEATGDSCQGGDREGFGQGACGGEEVAAGEEVTASQKAGALEARREVAAAGEEGVVKGRAVRLVRRDDDGREGRQDLLQERHRLDDDGLGNPHQPYTLFLAKGRMVAGVMPVPPEAKGMPPMWSGYIAVADIDAHVKKVKAAGGAVHRGPWAVPDVGRMAVAADPHGAGFMLFEPSGSDPNPPVPATTHGTWAGTNSTPANSAKPGRSIRSCSAGPSRRRWTWGRWAPTSCSPPTAPTSAA